MAETLRMALDMAAEAVGWLNRHGGLSIIMLIFTLTLWAEGTVGMFSGLAREWAWVTADAFRLPRIIRIMRGYLARRRRYAARQAVRFLWACDYAACRLFMNVADRERSHEERIRKERAKHRQMVYMRVRHRITASQRFAE